MRMGLDVGDRHSVVPHKRESASTRKGGLMQILTIASQKGGVGKTALALNLGWALARSGLRALVVDVDPQSGLSRSVASQLVTRKGLHDVVQGDATWQQVILPTRVEGFALLPLGRVSPWEASSFEATLVDGGPFLQLREAVSDDYDYLVIDTPAGLGDATMGALRAADYVMSPLQAEPGALRSATTLIETLGYLATHEHYAPQFLGFILGMVNRGDHVSSAVVTEAWRTFPEDLLFDTTIPRHGAFLEATSKGVPVGALGGDAKRIGMVFEQLVAEMHVRMGTQQ